MTSKNIYVDPPEGWRYGFPKIYNKEKDGDMLEWLHRNGVPEDVELAYIRTWEA